MRLNIFHLYIDEYSNNCNEKLNKPTKNFDNLFIRYLANGSKLTILY